MRSTSDFVLYFFEHTCRIIWGEFHPKANFLSYLCCILEYRCRTYKAFHAENIDSDYRFILKAIWFK